MMTMRNSTVDFGFHIEAIDLSQYKAEDEIITPEESSASLTARSVVCAIELFKSEEGKRKIIEAMESASTLRIGRAMELFEG
jgi:hypothetical protein